MKRILMIVVLPALLWVPAVLAELSQRYAGWAEGPEGFLLTKEERKEWGAVADDAAAERFIELFWARRDPDHSTPRNETREEFERRVEQADQSFGTERRRGALTDRGKVLILLGPPARGSRTEPGETVRAIGQSGVGSTATDDIRTRAEVWEYRSDQLPVSIRGPRFTIGFYEEHLNKNDFVLDRSLEGSTAVMRALAKAPETLIRHPKLTEVPASYRTAATSVDPARLGWLDRQAWPEGALLVADPAVAPGGTRPLWVHVELPAGAPALEVLTGRVSGADGAALSTFEVKAKPIALDTGTAYHLAVKVPSGGTTLELAGGAGAEPVFSRDVPLDIPPLPQGQVWVSQPWIGRSVTQEPSSKHGDPFNFGGWHLVPTAGRLVKGQELPYFGFASAPGGAQPDLTATVNLHQGTQKLAGPLEFKLTPSKLAEGLWMYGDTLGLTNLPAGGGYRLELTVVDKTSGTSARRDLELQVVQ